MTTSKKPRRGSARVIVKARSAALRIGQSEFDRLVKAYAGLQTFIELQTPRLERLERTVNELYDKLVSAPRADPTAALTEALERVVARDPYSRAAKDLLAEVRRDPLNHGNDDHP